MVYLLYCVTDTNKHMEKCFLATERQRTALHAETKMYEYFKTHHKHCSVSVGNVITSRQASFKYTCELCTCLLLGTLLRQALSVVTLMLSHLRT